MDQPFLSLAIPVYNVADELIDLFNCLSAFASKEVEVCFIDDGSTDDSAEKISHFVESNANSFANITFLQQDHHGIGYSRNQCLQNTQGEYLWFIDPDDAFNVIMAQQLVERLHREKLDLIQFSFNRFTADNQQEVVVNQEFPITYQHLSGQELFRMLGTLEVESYPWAHICRKSLYLNHQVEFPNDFNFEDVATTFKLFYYAEHCDFTTSAIYYYRQRPNSIVRSPTAENMRAFLSAIQLVANSGLADDVGLRRYVSESLMSAIRRTYMGPNTQDVRDARQQTVNFFLQYETDGLAETSKKASIIKTLLRTHIYPLYRKIRDR